MKSLIILSVCLMGWFQYGISQAPVPGESAVQNIIDNEQLRVVEFIRSPG